MSPPSLRQRLLEHALAHVGSPYLWPCAENGWKVGKGQRLPDGRRTFDCSGFVTCMALEVQPLLEVGGKPVVPAFCNANLLWKNLPPAEGPDAGEDAVVLALYGKPSRASHVEFVLPDGRALGASGGRDTTTTLAEAQARGAGVKLKASYLSRQRDFLGLRVLSLLPPAVPPQS